MRLGAYTIWFSRNLIDGPQGETTLEPKVMDLLGVLAAQNGAVVSRQDLIDAVWKTRFGGDESLTRAISILRRAFGDEGGAVIETIPKRGYRLVVSPVDESRDAPSTDASAIAIAPVAQTSAPSAAKPPLWPRHWPAVALGLAALALVAFLALRPPPPTAANIAARGAFAGFANAAQFAVADAAIAKLGVSARPAERSAYDALRSGADARALDILEALAADLETSGQAAAAAEVYTRIGAVALVIDQNRGIAARRRALQLAPGSLVAIQGLVFDTFLLQGFEPAAAIARETASRRDGDMRSRALGLALLAVLETDRDMGVDATSAPRNGLRTLEALRAMIGDTQDPVLLSYVAWVRCLIAFRVENLTEAAAALAESELLAPRLPPDAPRNHEVMRVRIALASGDWRRAFDDAAAILAERERTNAFLPAPLIDAACSAGLYLGRADAAAPYCAVGAARSEVSRGAAPKLTAAQLKAAAGDVRGARADAAAAQQLLSPSSPLEARRLATLAFIARRAGDWDEAVRLTDAAVAAAQTRPIASPRTFAATQYRLIGEALADAGRKTQACAALRSALDNYRDIGGEAGVRVVTDRRAALGCR
ncbi:MAG: winged helix-turn-helix domain-containing protein [Hyphomonadaceae bacterium]|nr:winged helix-turn-helix domain-containing protein [Hyphomonadaceae bacterium]